MASEDSVENLTLSDSPMLAVTVDPVGKLDDLYEPFQSAVPSLGHKVDSAREDLVIGYARGEAHVAAEEWNHRVLKDLAVANLQHEYRLVPWFGKIAPEPNSSAAISKSLRRSRC